MSQCRYTLKTVDLPALPGGAGSSHDSRAQLARFVPFCHNEKPGAPTVMALHRHIECRRSRTGLEEYTILHHYLAYSS